MTGQHQELEDILIEISQVNPENLKYGIWDCEEIFFPSVIHSYTGRLDDNVSFDIRKSRREYTLAIHGGKFSGIYTHRSRQDYPYHVDIKQLKELFKKIEDKFKKYRHSKTREFLERLKSES